MADTSPLGDAARRIEVNLRAPQRIATPLGTVELGPDVHVRGPAAEVVLSAKLKARQGWVVFRRTREIALKLIRVSSTASPAGLCDLRSVLDGHEDRYGHRHGGKSVLAFFSASGWSEEAQRYVRNDPPGTGYVHSLTKLVLLGPPPFEAIVGVHDDLSKALLPILHRRTTDEAEAAARRLLEESLAAESYAVLGRVSRDADLDPVIVENMARSMVGTDDGLKIERLPDAGLVLRRRS